MENITFGLIGKNLSHSFSKDYFTKKFKSENLAYNYQNFEIDTIEEFLTLKSRTNVKGFNVTIPYKKSIIPFLDDISFDAKVIGAVNCISFNNGLFKGHNTDHIGFANSIKPFLALNHDHALILGTGGASKAVAFTFENLGIKYFFVTSALNKQEPNTFFYHEINEHVLKHFQCIVNTTPLGMFPNIDKAPNIPFEYITKNHLCIDLIYNPSNTIFLNKAKQQGATILNGASMLQIQADQSWKIWQKYL